MAPTNTVAAPSLKRRPDFIIIITYIGYIANGRIYWFSSKRPIILIEKLFFA